MLKYSDLFGSGGSAILGPTLATNFFESRTWTAPQDGIVIVRGMGAGGGGANGWTTVSATGGYSGSWGCKIVRVKKGDTVGVAIGAGGAGKSWSGNGMAGGDTVITIGGVQYIAYGGPGGVAGAAGPLPDGPAPSANWDFGAASVKPGWVDGVYPTGGAGVDILAQGNNATTSDSTPKSGGGGTGSKSVGSWGGGAMPGGMSAYRSLPATNDGRAIFVDASQGEWGISFYGGSGGPGSGSSYRSGGNGGGGGSEFGAGGNGGGGGGGTSSGNIGGIGGGGGGYVYSGSGAAGFGGQGGQGFAHLKFFADMGV